MLYREWMKSNEADAANVTEFKSLSGDIENSDGSINVDKIMGMSVLMCHHNSDGSISITLC